MINRIRKRISDHPVRSFIVASGMIAFLAYGLLIPQLGMYGDDPNFLWAYHRGGPNEYKEFMGWIREYGYLVYSLLSPVFGESIISWRIATLVLRWGSSILFFLVFNNTFPNFQKIIVPLSISFLLYPGFMEQAIPVEFLLHFFSLDLILVSLLFTYYGIKRGKGGRIFLFLSVLSEISGLFICEYFAGLELFRPIIIWQTIHQIPQVSAQSVKNKIKKTGLFAFPYLLIFGFFLYWRAFLSSSTYMSQIVTVHLRDNPAMFIGNLMRQILSDLKVAVGDAWLRIFQIPSPGKMRWIYLAIFSFVGIVTWLLIVSIGKEKEKLSDQKLCGFLLIGIFLFLTGGIPVWAAGLKISLTLYGDRLSLSFMAGACIIVMALSALILRQKYFPVLLAILIAFMAGYQFQLQNQFRKEWDLAKNYFWQLAWRAPDISPNTLVLGDQFPFRSLTDNSLNALLNWNYESPEYPDRELYKFFQISAREGMIDPLPANSPLSHNDFRGNISDTILLYATPTTCLKVLTTADRNLPFLNIAMKKNLWRSKPERIIPNLTRTVTFQSFMGTEPIHGWCYYFEKGELSAQQNHWKKVVEIGKEAESAGLIPSTMIEMKSFFFAALLENDLETAERWKNLILTEKGNANYFLYQIKEFQNQSHLSKEAELILDQIQEAFQRELESL